MSILAQILRIIIYKLLNPVLIWKSLPVVLQTDLNLACESHQPTKS